MDLASLTAGQTIPSRFVENVAKNESVIALRARREDGTYRELTFGQYADQVARCAAGLKALGFGPGQRLVLMLRNRPEFHVADMAAYFCGGTAVSIYNSSSSEQIQYLVNHCEATIALADDRAFLERFLAIREQLPTLRHIGVLGADAPEGVFRWDSLVDHAPIDLAGAARIAKPEDLATLIYTSGTTGPSKAVMLTHQNIVSAIASIEQLNHDHPVLSNPAGIRVVSYLPMAHIAERNTTHYFASLLGHEVTCCPEATQIAMYLREVKPQIMLGVPRVWEKLYGGIQAAVSGDPERAKKLKEAVDAALPLVEKIKAGTATEQEKGIYQFLDDVAFKNLRALIGLDQVVIAITGAAPMTRELQLWFRAIGVPISDVYGMSENGGAMTWTPHAAKPGTVGKAIPGLEVKLAEDGEIMCRGPMVTSGYLKEPEKTAEAIKDGWLCSGDIGKYDEDGYLRIVDRKKELIITAGGKNVSPANLEASLKSIPLIGQACAIGDDKPFVSALLVLDPDVAKAWAARRGIPNASLAELASHPELIAEVESGLPLAMASFNGAERVKRVRILGADWLPDSEELTPTSKLKRRAIHAKYGAEIDEMYGTTLAPPADVVAPAAARKRA
jgi:long-chain acyl-CoA synthetase